MSMNEKKTCSFCNTQQATTFVLDSMKCEDECLKEKLSEAMGKEHGSFVANILIKSNFFIICRSCISVIKKICDTKTMFSKNLGMALPQTTCISIPNCSGDASADHSYSIESESIHSATPTVQVANTIIDHSYMINNTLVNQLKYRKENLDRILKDTSNTTRKLTDDELLEIQKISHEVKTVEDIMKLFKIPSINASVKAEIIRELKMTCADLATKKIERSSVLLQKKGIKNMVKQEDVINEIFQEVKDRFPFLLDILLSVAHKNDNVPIKYGHISAAYAILMSAREPELSLFQRLTSVICIRGHMEDMIFTWEVSYTDMSSNPTEHNLGFARLNKLGLTMSTSTKLRLLDECGDLNSQGLKEYLQQSPLLKITGDNFDVYIKTGNLTTVNRNTDLHLFALNAITCRIATPDMSTKFPKLDELQLQASDVLLNDDRLHVLKEAFTILLSRVLSDFKDFSWLKSITPDHIPHPFSRQMREKNQVFQLPIQFRNEAKYEDCLHIMTYETSMLNVFSDAHGTTDAMAKYNIVVGGDHLTRVRLEGCKHLRLQAPNPADRFDHLHPIVIELWHLKQDFLEKLYKQLYDAKSSREQGTLAYFKTLLRRTDVTGKVKSNFQGHADLIKIVVKGLIVEQFLSFFDMQNENDHPSPSNIIIPDNISSATKINKVRVQQEILESFLKYYGYIPSENIVHSTDELFNYCNQLCLWGLQFFEMEDTAKEGDICRVIPNLSHNISFFYSHSCLSKYPVRKFQQEFNWTSAGLETYSSLTLKSPV